MMRMALPTRRVAAILLVVAVVATLIGAYGALRGSDDGERALLETRAQMVVPALCELQTLIDAKDWNGANRLFYDRVHQDSHILGSLVEPVDRSVYGEFLRAKGDVERDLATLSPALATSVPAFSSASRASVGAVGLVGAEFPCA
jgi:hypothetical protein